VRRIPQVALPVENQNTRGTAIGSDRRPVVIVLRANRMVL
jgi:hypothetical protein